MFDDPVTNPKGWEVKTYGELLKLSSGNGLTSSQMDSYGKYPVYGGNGINGAHSEYMFDEPQIVIGRVGVYCGSVHITQSYSWITDNALYVKEYLQEIDIDYLCEAMKLANFNQYAGRAAQSLISGSRIYLLSILLPPLEKQRAFAKVKSQLQKFQGRHNCSNESRGSLFYSLSQKAFSGNLQL